MMNSKAKWSIIRIGFCVYLSSLQEIRHACWNIYAEKFNLRSTYGKRRLGGWIFLDCVIRSLKKKKKKKVVELKVGGELIWNLKNLAWTQRVRFPYNWYDFFWVNNWYDLLPLTWKIQIFFFFFDILKI